MLGASNQRVALQQQGAAEHQLRIQRRRNGKIAWHNLLHKRPCRTHALVDVDVAVVHELRIAHRRADGKACALDRYRRTEQSDGPRLGEKLPDMNPQVRRQRRVGWRLLEQVGAVVRTYETVGTIDRHTAHAGGGGRHGQARVVLPECAGGQC